MAAFANLDFEQSGVNPGDALGWTRNAHTTAESIADFGDGGGAETFERGWLSNDTFVFGFAPGTLTLAGYPSLAGPVGHESFEQFWASNENFAFALGGDVAAELGAPGGAERFETGWSNDAFSFVLGGATPGRFDPGALPVEAFEGGWQTNQAYKFAFSGIGVDLVGATYDNRGFTVEDFDAVAFDVPFTADSATDVLTAAAHNIATGTQVLVLPDPAGLAPAGGLALNQRVYFVVNTTVNTLKLSLTSGGAAVDVTASGTGLLRLDPRFFWNEKMKTI